MAAIHFEVQEDPIICTKKFRRLRSICPPHPKTFQLRMESTGRHPPISEVAAGVGRKLLDCENCDRDSQAKTYVRHPVHEWCINVRCRQHPVHDGWWVCIACNCQRKRMVTPDQIQRHYRVYHIRGQKKKGKIVSPNCRFH